MPILDVDMLAEKVGALCSVQHETTHEPFHESLEKVKVLFTIATDAGTDDDSSQAITNVLFDLALLGMLYCDGVMDNVSRMGP